MDAQFSYIVIPTTIAGTLGILSFWLLWNRRKTEGFIPLLLLFVSLIIWSIVYAFEQIIPSYAAKVILLKSEYFGIVSVPVFWLLFCLRYVNIRKPETARYFLIFSVIPLITLGLVFTNSSHHLIWHKITLIDIYGIKLLHQDYGAWFWLHIYYSFTLYLSGITLLVQYHFKIARNLRHHVRFIILAALIPGIYNIFYLNSMNPFPSIDLTSLSFAVSGILIVWVLHNHKFLDIIPIARDTLIENMRDGIIVVDLKDRIVDINPAAEKIINHTFKDIIGQPTKQILTEIADWISLSKETKTPVKILNVGEGKNKKIFVLNLSPLSDAND
ncbi:MAG: PAS domain-containing protein, partial [Anaerolineales bacterium]|nr:PAS domain-containing protein [Anaerolineales bacterium]